MKPSLLRLTAILAIAFAMFAGVAVRDAAAVGGSVTLHFRACPTDAVDVYADCHGNPAAGVAYIWDGLPVQYSPVNGDDYVGEIDGAHSLVVDEAFAIYCSEASDPATYLDPADFTVEEGDAVTCDIYVVDPLLPLAHPGGGSDGQGTGVPSALPSTGSGPTNEGPSSILILFTCLVAGMLGFATRRLNLT